MNNALSTYTFALPSGCTHDIRVIDREGNPWFVAADVCRALGIYSASRGVHNAIKGLKDDERAVLNTTTLSRGNPNITYISESGLYRLTMRSDKPEARQFQDWVTRIVLPSIRKDGAYVMGEEKVASGHSQMVIPPLLMP